MPNNLILIINREVSRGRLLASFRQLLSVRYVRCISYVGCVICVLCVSCVAYVALSGNPASSRIQYVVGLSRTVVPGTVFTDEAQLGRTAAVVPSEFLPDHQTKARLSTTTMLVRRLTPRPSRVAHRAVSDDFRAVVFVDISHAYFLVCIVDTGAQFPDKFGFCQWVDTLPSRPQIWPVSEPLALFMYGRCSKQRSNTTADVIAYRFYSLQ